MGSGPDLHLIRSHRSRTKGEDRAEDAFAPTLHGKRQAGRRTAGSLQVREPGTSSTWSNNVRDPGLVVALPHLPQSPPQSNAGERDVPLISRYGSVAVPMLWRVKQIRGIGGAQNGGVSVREVYGRQGNASSGRGGGAESLSGRMGSLRTRDKHAKTVQCACCALAGVMDERKASAKHCERAWNYRRFEACC